METFVLVHSGYRNSVETVEVKRFDSVKDAKAFIEANNAPSSTNYKCCSIIDLDKKYYLYGSMFGNNAEASEVHKIQDIKPIINPGEPLDVTPICPIIGNGGILVEEFKTIVDSGWGKLVNPDIIDFDVPLSPVSPMEYRDNDEALIEILEFKGDAQILGFKEEIKDKK